MARERAPHRRRLRLLGAEITVLSNSRRLLAHVDDAFADLPALAVSHPMPRLEIKLLLDPDSPRRMPVPRPLRVRAGAGIVIGEFDATSYALIAVDAGTALVRVGRALLAHPYHLRYELIEFVFYTLAPLAQRLMPLHAACVARGGRALLLIGASGAGKSTLGVCALAAGFGLVAEDAVFVARETLRATGSANYLHLCADALRWVDDARLRAAFRASPVIVRRSGARKLELDARRARVPLARRAPRIAALVQLSARRGATPKLEKISRHAALAVLCREQPYAARQAGWPRFVSRLARVPAYRLSRGAHPALGAVVLRRLLDEQQA